MSLANLPRDGEPIAEAKKGPLNETLLVPTPLFLRFLEDLVTVSESVPDATPELNLAITRLKSVQNDAERYISNTESVVMELQSLVQSQRRQINELNQRVSNLEQLR